MSGNSGGSFGGGGGAAPQNCYTLSILTNLSSPIPAVLTKLQVGDILEIKLSPPAGPVQAITSSGELAGAVLHMDIDSLIQCISDGHEFHAKIKEIKGGYCQILITHK